MSEPYLVRMSLAAFDELPDKVVPRAIRIKDPALQSPEAMDFILSGYCRRLLDKNERLQDLFRRFVGKLDDAECKSCLTQGQRILLSLCALDGEVTNGGIAQFFWNCPDQILEVGEALESLGEMALAKSYDKALQGLIGNKDDWIDLRNRSSADPDHFWEPFQESYDLLDLGWFDDEYFKTHGPSLVKRLVDYVRSHKEEFIES